MEYKVKAKIYAILFGVDERVLGIQLQNGYKIEKKSLVPIHGRHLEEVFNINHDEFKRQYLPAVIDSSLNVACACKEIVLTYFEQSKEIMMKKFNDDVTKEMNVLDRQLHLIRLITESAICFNVFCFIGEIDDKFNTMMSASPSIGESYARTEAYSTIWAANSISMVNAALLQQPPSTTESMLWSTARGLYDVSYFQLNNPNSHANALTLLVTSLEMLFLGKNNGAKKEMLAKRCASYIATSDIDRDRTYLELKNLYRIRSKYVHDGNLDVTADNVHRLRGYVRCALLKYRAEIRSKKELIEDLKFEITSKDYFVHLAALKLYF